jgi:D-lactate dehydrogenase
VRPDPLHDRLRGIVAPARVLTRPIDLVAFASDASFYRLVPRAVVLSSGIEEIRALFAASRAQRVPLTFRAAGSSLSGQAITNGLLVEVARHWRGIRVEGEGRVVRVQPGAIGATVNAHLARHGRKIGPDPASIDTCTMGGILSNNSSGMCCGVAQNAYHTLESLTFVLPSGTIIDTASPDADERLRAAEPALWEGLKALKARVEANVALAARIRSKYRTKNTTGYGLNALLDFDRPLDIFAHLLIGAEGTLAFIAEAVLRTVPILPVRYTGLLLFPSMHAACGAIVPLRDAGAAALEVMDRAALRSVETQPGIPPRIHALPSGATGLLAEFQTATEDARGHLERIAADAVGGLRLQEPAVFTHVAREQALLWNIRKGMFPSVGAVRRSGTTVIIEDVAFPVETLADAAVDLTALMHAHGYPDGIIFGHAKDGNLHFVLSQSFNARPDVDQYARFMDEVVRLVVERYDGALKAEHGTGRNMAPFVEAEWGPEAVEVMRQVKALADPDGLLNPGVILNPNPRAHLTDLKPLPSIDPEVDKCIECGYCEPKCPTRDITLTPRQRIVVRREIARLDGSGGGELLDSLRVDYAWMGVESCAADGLCATACPVSIDTGALMKRLRHESHGPAAEAISARVAGHFRHVEWLVRSGLRLGHAVQTMFGPAAMPALTRVASRVLGPLPQWTPVMPRPAVIRRPGTSRENAAAVYFPSCLSRMMGALPCEAASPSLTEALVAVAERAGRPVHVPQDTGGTCCGVPFSSKGYVAGHRVALTRAIDRFWRWSDEGRLPIVIDASPCTYGLRSCRSHLAPEARARFDRLQIVDVVEFLDTLMPHLTVRRRVAAVALHPVCSATKMGLGPVLQRIASQCADRAHTPLGAGCCGMAGDRGLVYPAVAASATALEAGEVREGGYLAGYSSSRTCELNLTRETGVTYRSVVFLVEEATRG